MPTQRKNARPRLAIAGFFSKKASTCNEGGHQRGRQTRSHAIARDRGQSRVLVGGGASTLPPRFMYIRSNQKQSGAIRSQSEANQKPIKCQSNANQKAHVAAEVLVCLERALAADGGGAAKDDADLWNAKGVK